MVPFIGWVIGLVFALVSFILGIVACTQSRPADGIMAIIGAVVVVPLGGLAGGIGIFVLGLGASAALKTDKPPAPVVQEAPAVASDEPFGAVLARAEKGDAEAQYQVGLHS